MQHNSCRCLTPESQLLFTAFSAYNLQLCACHAGKFGLRLQQTTLDAITISGFLSIYLFAMFVSYPCFSTNIDVLFVKGRFASLIIQPRPGPVRVGYEGSTVHPNSLGQYYSATNHGCSKKAIRTLAQWFPNSFTQGYSRWYVTLSKESVPNCWKKYVTIKDHLQAERLNIVLKQMRRNHHSTTEVTPYQLVLGREIRTELNLLQ